MDKCEHTFGEIKYRVYEMAFPKFYNEKYRICTKCKICQTAIVSECNDEEIREFYRKLYSGDKRE